MKKALIVTMLMALMGFGLIGSSEEGARPLGGFFFFEARPWADALGTHGDAWINLGGGFQTHTWFVALGMGYPSALTLSGYWAIQGAVILPISPRASFTVGVTVTTWIEAFQAWELYAAPFIGYEFAWRPDMILFVRANLPLHVYEDLPLGGMYISFGLKASPW